MGRSAFAVPATLLAVLTIDVRTGGPLSRWEQRHLSPPPAEPGPWPTLTRLGDRSTLAVLTLSAMVVAGVRRRTPLRPATLALGGVAGRLVLARSVGRERPPRDWWRTRPDGPSFPSRHVTWIGLGMLALVRELPPGPARTALPAAVAAVGVECYSRVRLGVHWPTDTAGAVLLLLALGTGATPRDWPGPGRSGTLGLGDGARPAAPKRTR